MSNFQASIPDDLLNIYTTLGKLGYLKGARDAKAADGEIDFAIFPRKFLLKLLDERLEDLSDFAQSICEDLFKQIGGKAKTIDQKQLNQLDLNKLGSNSVQECVRYPEFDEYFHCCVHYLHDFLIDLHWHETNVHILTKSDSEYVTKTLKYYDEFLQFKLSLKRCISPPKSTSSPVPKQHQVPEAKSRKSNLTSSSLTGENRSPTLRRRVRFQSSPSLNDGNSTANVDNPDHDDRDLLEIHSTHALELLIYAIDIFVQLLKSRFENWSLPVEAKLAEMLDLIFDSNTKIRTSQLNLFAKRVKILMDVHLTVLDYLSEIKTTYLVGTMLNVICGRDTHRLSETFKRPNIVLYATRCSDIERSILVRLVKQSLKIFLGLLVCEVNFPPVELSELLSQKIQQDANKGHANMINFITGWLQVDDILFGYARPRKTREKGVAIEIDKMAKQIQRPKIAEKFSTLSLDGAYTSSSRILAQMDNLGEFLKTFISVSSNRLRYREHMKYFFESIATGLLEFFKIVSEKIKRQVEACSHKSLLPRFFNGAASISTQQLSSLDDSLDSIIAKIRCLKLIHIMRSAEALVRTEARRVEIELTSLSELTSRLDKFTEICIGLKVTKDLVEGSINTKQVNK